jgi:murein L,D-transpeptidase YcbB/YkuD
VIAVPRAGKALILALFCVSAAACGSRSGVQPKQVDPAALQSEVRGPLERAFYQARQWQAAWDGKSEKELLAIVGQAPANGLKPDLFLKGELPADPSAREAALTRLALSYASALANGYADPRKLREIYTLPRPRTNVAAGLAQAFNDGNLDQWFASLVPQTDEYRALSEAHVQYLRLATKAQGQPIAAGKAIKPGRRDPRVPQVAAALAASGYLAAPPPAEEGQPPAQLYSPAMVAAVRRLQADYGLKPDGAVGPDTLAVLNSGPSDRARQLAVALERLRWLERSPPATRIDVNTAAAFLQYIRGGRPVDRRKVVVGEPGWETPQLQSQMFQLVANPLWRVPDSILEDELSKKSGAYLAANGFEWRDGRLVQRSGEKNSLGLVKFDLTNKQSIYLHDTPAKALFALPERHRSHGCIRVENALQFAAMIAAENAILDELEEGLASGDETYVKLKTEIPVRLLYHTAFLDGGRVQFRPDIYGWDDDVAYAIGLKRGPPRKAYKRSAEDIGP